MSPHNMSDKEWFDLNPDRMFRLRELEKSDPHDFSQRLFRKISKFVVVRRSWGGGFCVTLLPASFDLKADSEQLLISKYDSVLCGYINLHGVGKKGNQTGLNSMLAVLIQITNVIKKFRGCK